MSLAKTAISVLILIILFSAVISASEFKVTGVDISSTEWGKRTAKIGMIRSVNDYRYVVAISEVTFPEVASAPTRMNKKVFITEPADSTKSDDANTTILDVPYEVPSAYGTGIIKFTLYNVVDTVDILLESQKFYFKEFEFTVDTAEAFKVLLDSGIQVPIFVDQIPAFDGYFNRILMLLLHRGKSPVEIAELCGVSPEFVHRGFEKLMKAGYVKMIQGKYSSNFIIVDKNNLNKLRPEIDNTIDILYDIFKENIKAYDSALTSLAQTGALTRDPNDLLDGGSVLYHKHPTVMALFLWDRLGRDFINDGEAFTLYSQSDKREAYMGQFMYLIEGDQTNIGKTFYYYVNDTRGERLYSGMMDKPYRRSSAPSISNDLPINLDWSIEEQPILFSYNEKKAQIPFSTLRQGSTEPIDKLKIMIDEYFPVQQGNNKFLGARYWCWNIIVESIMKKFEDEKLIEREGPGIYVFQRTEY